MNRSYRSRYCSSCVGMFVICVCILLFSCVCVLFSSLWNTDSTSGIFGKDVQVSFGRRLDDFPVGGTRMYIAKNHLVTLECNQPTNQPTFLSIHPKRSAKRAKYITNEAGVGEEHAHVRFDGLWYKTSAMYSLPEQ